MELDAFVVHHLSHTKAHRHCANFPATARGSIFFSASYSELGHTLIGPMMLGESWSAIDLNQLPQSDADWISCIQLSIHTLVSAGLIVNSG